MCLMCWNFTLRAPDVDTPPGLDLLRRAARQLPGYFEPGSGPQNTDSMPGDLLRTDLLHCAMHVHCSPDQWQL